MYLDSLEDRSKMSKGVVASRDGSIYSLKVEKADSYHTLEKRSLAWLNNMINERAYKIEHESV